MKRFIDLRGQGTCSRFAWFDTVSDTFEQHSGCQDWDTFAEFEADYTGAEIGRFRSLAPAWVFEIPTPDDF